MLIIFLRLILFKQCMKQQTQDWITIDLCENLLSSWLAVTASVRNERMVHFLTFQEVFICNILSHDMGVHKDMDPFITLSFMALTVIPEIRLTPRGIYNVTEQRFLSV